MMIVIIVIVNDDSDNDDSDNDNDSDNNDDDDLIVLPIILVCNPTSSILLFQISGPPQMVFLITSMTIIYLNNSIPLLMCC